MIKNRQQLTVTERQLALLLKGIEKLRGSDQPKVLVEAGIGFLNVDISKLETQIEDYKSADRGEFDELLIQSVHDVGRQLIQGRIANHLSQADLAEKLGQLPQQIQRYERDLYSSANLETVTRVADLLKSKVVG